MNSSGAESRSHLHFFIAAAVIMGATVIFQAVATRPDGPRLQRLLYIFVTTGLCGSITSFSTWHGEVAKRFVLPVYADIACDKSTVDVARVLEYATHLGAGLALPFCSFVFGTHFGEALASWQWLCGSLPIVQGTTERASVIRVVTGDENDSCCSRCADSTGRYPLTSEVVIAVIAVASTLAVVGLPLGTSVEWLCPVALFGAAGAYTRYMLSRLNRLWPTFPLGTFIANMLGTVLLATSEFFCLSVAWFGQQMSHTPASSAMQLMFSRISE